ncbi:MAG: CPBP family intramembrane glutamic endopeptidase [Bacteroidales bacterium]
MDLSDLFPELKAGYVLGLTVLSFLAYRRTAYSDSLSSWLIKGHKPEHATVLLFLFRKAGGFFFFGLIPALLFFPFFKLQPQLYVNIPLPGLIMFPVLLVAVLITMFLSAKKNTIRNRLPLMRIRGWSPLLILTSITGWGIYLAAYEFLFRGLLLFSWVEAFGVLPAVIVNLVLYGAVHLQNGRKEAMGSIIFGLILCLLSLQTGSFLMAFLLHLSLSVSAEMSAVFFNPDMRFILRRKE